MGPTLSASLMPAAASRCTRCVTARATAEYTSPGSGAGSMLTSAAHTLSRDRAA